MLLSRSRSYVVLFLFLASVIPAAAVAHNADDPKANTNPSAQVWKGVVKLPGMPLEFVVRLTPGAADTPWTGTIDIPMQGAKGLALSDIHVDSKNLGFTLPVSRPAVFQLTLKEDGRHAEGHMDQSGQTFDVTAERITESESADVGPKRPQTPKGPFPYRSEEVSFRNEKEDFSLAGTLTLPKGDGPFPAVVMVTGSGTQDRDETIFGHKPFLVIADYLTRRGIAVLRYDDRGAGGSQLDMKKLLASTSENMANDARAAVKYLRGRKDIDPKRVGLIGHSEGGMIVAMIAADDKDIACIVMLAGSALPGREILPKQLERIDEAAGVSRELIDRQLKAQKKWMDLLVKGAPEDELRGAVRELVAAQLEADGQTPSKEQLDKIVDEAVKTQSGPWMKFFLSFDPRTALRRVKCPVLALNGSLDMQVVADDNLPAIRAALKEAGNKEVSVRKLLGLNHLFQHAKTGLPAEYAQIEETISPQVLVTISDWLRQQLDVESGQGVKSK